MQALDFPDIILFAIPFFAITLLLELYVTTRERWKAAKGYELKDAFASLAMGLGNVFIGFLR